MRHPTLVRNRSVQRFAAGRGPEMGPTVHTSGDDGVPRGVKCRVKHAFRLLQGYHGAIGPCHIPELTGPFAADDESASIGTDADRRHVLARRNKLPNRGAGFGVEQATAE